MAETPGIEAVELGATALRALPDEPRLRVAAQSVVSALAAVPEVDSLWFAGSLGRGEGDAYSDLDLVAIARPGVTFPADQVRAAVVSALRPVLSLERDFGQSLLVSVVNPDWVRVDVDIFRADAPLHHRADRVRCAFDRGVTPPTWTRVPAEVPATPDPTGPAGELIRVLGLLPVLLGRGHLVTAYAGCGLLASHLLALATTLHPPAAPCGVMAAEGALPDSTRAILERLPPVGPTRESLTTFHCAAWGTAQDLLAEADAVLPANLAPAVAALDAAYRRDLGVGLHDGAPPTISTRAGAGP